MSDDIRDSFNSMFKMVDPNGKYKPAKVAVFYHIIGETMLQSPITNKRMDIDMRFNFGLTVRSGLGKLPIKEVVKESANKINMSYSEFTSLQEEQLIGKKWDDKGKTHEVRGYFYDNFLVKDDGLPFINDSRFELARNYTLTALDVYGKNLLFKRIVEMKEPLKYYGRCSFLFFIQPSEIIKTANISSGLFRRAPILRIDLNDDEEKQIIMERMSMDFDPKPEKWINFLSFIRNISFYYKEVDKEINTLINNQVIALISKDSLLSTLNIINQNNILKWSYINSLIRLYINKSYKTYKTEMFRLEDPENSKDGQSLTYKTEKNMDLDIVEEDVKQAIKDYRIVYGGIKKFVSENEYDRLNEYEHAMIDLLTEKEAFDEKTGMGGKEFMKLIMKRTNEKKPTLMKHFYKLREEKVIFTKRSQYGSVVWL